MSEAAIAEAPEQTQANPEATQGTGDTDHEEADALLRDLETPNATETETGEGTEGDGEDTPSEDEEQEAAIQARATELAEQRAQELAKEQEAKRKADEAKAKAKAEAEGVTTAFRGRAEAIRNFGKENGWESEAVERLVSTFETHHAQSAPVAQRVLQEELAAEAGLEDYEWESSAAFVSAIRDSVSTDAKKGLLTETQVNRKVADSLLAQKRRFQKNPELLTSQTNGASDRTPNGGRDNRSDNEILSDPNTPVEKLMEIRARQRGE